MSFNDFSHKNKENEGIKQIWENAMSELPLANTASVNTDKYITIRLYHTKVLWECNITVKLSKERKKKDDSGTFSFLINNNVKIHWH